ncbi:amino acid permease-domain-containing protein, partial [Lophiotrema nucula]
EKVAPPSSPTQIQSTDAASQTSEGGQTELRQTLKERHVNMIGFSTVLGLGLFLSAGKAIYMAGPGAAVLAYLVAGTIMWSVMACLGEMTALFPVKGPIFEFPRRFIDESVGLAIGWIAWFSWVVTLAAEIMAITEVFHFQFKREYLNEVKYPSEKLEWRAGVNTNPAVWVGIFLIVALMVNLLPVRQYGRIEYVCGCLKITFLVGLILFNTILNARQSHSSRFWTYEKPYGFAKKSFTVNDTHTYTGSLGGLTSFWTTLTTTLFSLVGWEVIFLTAAENRDLRKSESLKLATRKITIRVLILYALCAFTVGLNVPWDDANLGDLTIHSITGGQNSVFILAAVREHVKVIPHIFNAFFIFSPLSTGINDLYGASRILHALASHRDAWPDWPMFEAIRSRLETTRNGVPVAAVTTSWLVGFVAFLSVNSAQAKNLGRMATVVVVANLIIYAANCVAYLQFYRQIKAAANGQLDEDLNLTPDVRNFYKRTARQYPYRSHLQWVRAAYALLACILLALFNGWQTFVSPMSTRDFVASYIAV